MMTALMTDATPNDLTPTCYRVVLDTNVLFQHRRLDGPSFELLEEFLRQSRSQLYVPRIVLDEASKKFQEDLRKKIDDVDAAIKRLNGVLSTDCGAGPPTITLDDCVSEYDRSLLARLKDLGAQQPGFGDLSIQDLADRALKERRPFLDRDRGFRDALLWETILKDTLHPDFQTVLVTSDAGFANDGILHPDLQQDLLEAGHTETKVTLLRSMEELLETIVKPALALHKAAFDRIELIKEHLLGDIPSLQSGAAAFADDLMAEAQIFDPDLRNIEGDYELVDLQVDLETLEVEDTYELDGGRVFMKVSIDCDAAVDGFVFKANYYGMRDGAPVSVMESDWNEHYMWVQVAVDATLTVNLTVEAGSGEIRSFEVERLSAREPNYSDV